MGKWPSRSEPEVSKRKFTKERAGWWGFSSNTNSALCSILSHQVNPTKGKRLNIMSSCQIMQIFTYLPDLTDGRVFIIVDYLDFTSYQGLFSFFHLFNKIQLCLDQRPQHQWFCGSSLLERVVISTTWISFRSRKFTFFFYPYNKWVQDIFTCIYGVFCRSSIYISSQWVSLFYIFFNVLITAQGYQGFYSYIIDSQRLKRKPATHYVWWKNVQCAVSLHGQVSWRMKYVPTIRTPQRRLLFEALQEV